MKPTQPTKPTRSLRSDLTRAFWLFGGLLVAVFAGIVVSGSIEQEDLTLTRQLSLELEEYLEQNRETLTAIGSQPPPVHSRFFSAHLGLETLPATVRNLAVSLPDGVHELEEGWFTGEDYFVGIRSLPDRNERLYLVYDTRQLDEWLEFGRPSFRLFLIGGGTVLLLGLFSASRLSRRALEPVADLERIVSAHREPQALASALSQRSETPELVSLSSALEQSMRRLDAFVERERQFTRAASHELRTPVAVIQGATELLEQLQDRAGQGDVDPQQMAKLVGRIRRAVDQMQDLIEAFLWMAREDEANQRASWNTDLAAVLHDVVEQHRPLLANRSVSVEMAFEPSPPVAAPTQAVSVVLSNLVKNAFESTFEGSIRLESAGGRVRVLNPESRIGETSRNGRQARGFGLTIVEELCDRFGWESSLATDAEGGTVATVDFVPG